MAQSREYPELKFVEAKSYGSGRSGKGVRLIVIHYTAGSEGPTSAEDGAAYDARRTDGTSCNYFHDRNSTVQCVYTWDTAHSARRRGNLLGTQHELCGTAQTREQWLDAASMGTMKQAAKWVAADCRKYGIPVRRLSVAETRRAWTEFPNGPKGIVGHVDCTEAFPEDNGTHTDPGKAFPWDIFLRMVRDELEGDDVSAADVIEALESTKGQAAIATAAGRGTHNQKVGASDVTIGQVLQPIPVQLGTLLAAATSEATRDAQLAAVIAGMQSALATLAAANGALTPGQVANLTEQVRQAASIAGAEAVSALGAQVESLREHLGDDQE